jgi:squalene-hopene/tetraprenyl-beta-curcumene cyclase
VGGQLLPTVLSHVALTALGHGDNTALVQSCEELLELLVRPADGSEPSMVQPTLATTRETAWALLSLEALGVPEADASVQRAAHWLLDRQVVHRGDGLSGLAGGWAMQRNNPLGPDVETTGLALLALLRFARQAEPVSIGRHGNLQEAKRQLAHDLWPAVLPARVHAARSTANDWLMSLQNADGGWGQYGYAHGANQRYLVDHHDPWERSAADSTAVVVEQLARGKLASDPACVRGLQYLLDRQQSDGSWSVLWGQGCFDGTARGLIALHAMGLHGHEPPVERAIDYLRGRQQEHGAWPSGQRTQDPRGSVCNTGWCLLALLNYVPASEPLIVRAVDFLLRQQQLEGHWSDRHAVRTLMPGQQWMASSMETHCLVIRALASYAQMSRRQG